jgi:hypothetical protein
MLKEEGDLRDLTIDRMIILKLCYRELCEGVDWISVIYSYDLKLSTRVDALKSSREIGSMNVGRFRDLLGIHQPDYCCSTQ